MRKPLTPLQAFQQGARNHNLGIFPRDWYALSCGLSPERVAHDGSDYFGFRMLNFFDLSSGSHLHLGLVLRDPEPLKASDLIPFFEELLAQHGPPKYGLVISHSAHLSTFDLFIDKDTCALGAFLFEHGIKFDAMPQDVA